MRLLILCSFLLVLPIVSAFATDLSGTWNASVDFENGRQGAPSFALKQAGAKLTGTFSNPAIGEQPLTGTVTGDSFTFEVNASIQGASLKLSYRGKLDAGKLTGTMTRTVEGDSIEGKFTATKQ